MFRRTESTYSPARFFAEVYERDDSAAVREASLQAAQWRLQNEAKKEQERLQYVMEKLAPSAWNSVENRLVRKYAKPRCAELSLEVLQDFFREKHIKTALQFTVVGDTIECRLKTKADLDEFSNLQKEFLLLRKAISETAARVADVSHRKTSYERKI